MNKYFVFSLIGLMFLISLSLVSSTECNADLSQGGNNCTVSSSLLGGCYE